MNENQNIIIYQNDGGTIDVEVKLLNNDLWLSLNQIAELFGRDKSVIAKHLKNVFREEELDRNSTVAFFATVQIEGNHEVTRQIEHFNLDAIISVGYRVNSKRGTQFRRWSSQVLKDHLQKGYSINRLGLDNLKIKELQQSIELLSHTLLHQELVNDMGQEILTIITQYSKTWDTLLRYDEDRLQQSNEQKDDLIELNYLEAIEAINHFKSDLIKKGEASSLFGNFKDSQLEAILGNICQTFDSQPLYTTHIERAAHLLYFIIKDHPFSDGNKRIGCLLFLMYLHKAGLKNLAPENNSLIAMALLVAESNPIHKDLIIQLIMRLMS
jgi:death-on-curing family protein